MVNQGKVYLGPIGWIKVHVFHRCPRCGAKLIRQIATDEIFVTNGNPNRIIRSYLSPVYTEKTRITPVYLVCPRCGLRVHVKNITSRL